MTFLQYKELRKTNPDLYNHSFTQWRMVHDYKYLGHNTFFAIRSNNNGKEE